MQQSTPPVSTQPQNSMLTEKSNNEDTSSVQMSNNLMEMEQNYNATVNEMNASTLAMAGGSLARRKCGEINDHATKRCKKRFFMEAQLRKKVIISEF